MEQWKEFCVIIPVLCFPWSRFISLLTLAGVVSSGLPLLFLFYFNVFFSVNTKCVTGGAVFILFLVFHFECVEINIQ